MPAALVIKLFNTPLYPQGGAREKGLEVEQVY